MSRRPILPEAFVRDVTLRSGERWALVGGARVVVGADGRAASTIELRGEPTRILRGPTHVAGTVYVLAEHATGDAMLWREALPWPRSSRPERSATGTRQRHRTAAPLICR